SGWADVLEPTLIALRLGQYVGAMVLTGSSLFFVYALPRSGTASAAEAAWARPLLMAAAILLAVCSLLGLAAQSVMLSGSITEGLKGETLSAVVSGMDLGKAAVVRAAAAVLAALALLLFGPSRAAWMAAAALGSLATASLAWMGHGAAT